MSMAACFLKDFLKINIVRVCVLNLLMLDRCWWAYRGGAAAAVGPVWPEHLPLCYTKYQPRPLCAALHTPQRVLLKVRQKVHTNHMKDKQITIFNTFLYCGYQPIGTVWSYVKVYFTDHLNSSLSHSFMSFSLQLQAPEPIPESQATYGAVRPYRESPLLARARRTESFHSYRWNIIKP